MTQKEFRAGVWVIPKQFLYNAYDEDDLQMVADAAAQAEREACARLCDDVLGENNVSAAIRSRGEK